MNPPLGYPSAFPPLSWTPPTAPPGPAESLLAQVVQVAGAAADLLMPLLIGLAGGLCTWVILEVLRARHGQRRPRLPGRPPVWAPPHPPATASARKPRAPPGRATG
jgi:hypothetical protein